MTDIPLIMPLHIADLISRKIAEERVTDTRKKDIWHVTDLGKCLRGVYLKRQSGGTLDCFNDRQLRVFKAGKIFEEFVINTVPVNEIAELQGECLWPELSLVGSYDMLTAEGDGYHLWEIKSQNSQSFHYMLEDANPLHKQQVMMYASKLIEEGKKLVGISVAYISKDDLCTKQFDLEYNQSLVDEGIKTAKLLVECWSKKTPPALIDPIEMKNGKWVVSWRAKYCDCHSFCTGNENWLKEAEEECKVRNKEIQNNFK